MSVGLDRRTAATTSDGLPLELFDLVPPHRPGTVPVRRGESALRAPGTIICVRVDVPRFAGNLRDVLRRLRIDHASCAIVLWLRDSQPWTLIAALESAADAFVRAIVVDAQLDVEALRASLTDERHLVPDVITWCRLRGMEADPTTLALIAEIGRHQMRERGSELLVRDFSPSGLRNRFRRAGLPAPAEWQRLFAALAVALQLQRGNRTPLLRFAIDRGYCDHSSLSRALKRAFQTTPMHIRAALGWEWLVDRWYAQQSEWGRAADAVSKATHKWRPSHRDPPPIDSP